MCLSKARVSAKAYFFFFFATFFAVFLAFFAFLAMVPSNLKTSSTKVPAGNRRAQHEVYTTIAK
jgi:hypothetical protein